MEDFQPTDSAKDTVRSAHTDIGNDLVIDYTLYREKDNGRIFYSISVSVTSTGESAIVRDITGDSSRGEYIFDLVHHGGVTPICIFEVIEDLIESIP